jgi:hypothetical protein
MLFSAILSLALAGIASAHIVITYPGWRGDNLRDNEEFPYGMQWQYPCGGIGTTKNRTYWSTEGGAVAFQPGWFKGHETAFLYVNLGYGTDGPDNGPKNMSFPMSPVFQIIGPSNGAYPGTVCLPQVPLPVNASVKAGDKATIQVIEIAQHGAALYSCVDIIFAEPGDDRIPEVNETNCFNSTHLGFAEQYTIVTKNPGDDGPIEQQDAGARLGWTAAAGYAIATLAGAASWILL